MSCPCAHHQCLGGFEPWWDAGGSSPHELFTQYEPVVASAWHCVSLDIYP